MSANDAQRSDIPNGIEAGKSKIEDHPARTEAYKAMEQPLMADTTSKAGREGITVASVTDSHQKIVDKLGIPVEGRMLLAKTATGFAEEYEAMGHQGAAKLWRDYAKKITTEVG